MLVCFNTVALMWPSWHALQRDLQNIIKGDLAAWRGPIWLNAPRPSHQSGGVEDHSLLVHDMYSWTQQWPILCSLLWSTSWPRNHCPAASCSLNLHVRELKNIAHYGLFFLFCNAKIIHTLSCCTTIQVISRKNAEKFFGLFFYV